MKGGIYMRTEKVIDISEIANSRKEMGAEILTLMFLGSARTVAMGYELDPLVLMSDYDATPVDARFIFWNQVGAAMESIKTCYSLSQQECNKILADTIAELLGLPEREVN
jgi:hypothetical protein